MEENKTLVEQLRGITASDMCGFIETICPSSECDDFETCTDCVRHCSNVIADRIESEYLPRPRFEDGDPVRFGDEFSNRNDERDSIRCIAVYDDGLYVLVGKDGVKECVPSGDRVKRHEPEVLDADGVPIKVGDKVFHVVKGDEYEVVGFHIGTFDVEAKNIDNNKKTWIGSNNLTHKQPDTLERIEADAKEDFWHYWGCSGARCVECPALIDGKAPEEHYHTYSCADAKVLDLLRRQRELLERRQA